MVWNLTVLGRDFKTFAALEKLDTSVYINRKGKTIRIKFQSESLCYYGLQLHKPQLDEDCSKLIDESEQTKLEYFGCEINGDNLNSLSYET